MRGLHLTCDLRDCAAERDVMTDTATLRALCLEAVARAGLTAVGDLFHRYVPADAARPPAAREAPSGITGVVLLAESHLAVHTWPELRAATLDVYVCNVGDDNSAKAERLLATLVDAFAPASQERHARRRGSLAGSA